MPTRKVICYTALLATLVPWTAQAQQFATAKGVCEKFVIGRDAMTSSCDNKIVSTTYADGRLGFYFTFKRGTVVTFSGIQRPNPSPNVALTSIDKIIFNIAGASKSFNATGSCRFGNYKAGKKRIVCKGMSDDGQPFEAVFRMTSQPEGM